MPLEIVHNGTVHYQPWTMWQVRQRERTDTELLGRPTSAESAVALYVNRALKVDGRL